MGFFLWGTYRDLRGELGGLFPPARRDNANRSAREQVSLRRYGVTSGTGNFGWVDRAGRRRDQHHLPPLGRDVQCGAPADGTGDFRNEPYQFGWCVEIDPYDKTRAPRKAHRARPHGPLKAPGTASGCRGAASPSISATMPATNISTSSSRHALEPGRRAGADRLAIGDKYLDAGTCTWRASTRTAPARGCLWCSARCRTAAHGTTRPMCSLIRPTS
jgi:hypothetical protein